MSGKRCPNCKILQSRTAFHRDRSAKDGLQFHCKICQANHLRKWTKNNPGRKFEYHKRWVKANAVRVREVDRRWYKANVERRIHQNWLRELRKRHRTPVWANLKAIAEFYKEAKLLTAATGIRYDVDHIIPLVSRIRSVAQPIACGLHVHNNLQVITHELNTQKGDRLPVEFEDWIYGPAFQHCVAVSRQES